MSRLPRDRIISRSCPTELSIRTRRLMISENRYENQSVRPLWRIFIYLFIYVDNILCRLIRRIYFSDRKLIRCDAQQLPLHLCVISTLRSFSSSRCIFTWAATVFAPRENGGFAKYYFSTDAFGEGRVFAPIYVCFSWALRVFLLWRETGRTTRNVLRRNATLEKP